MQTWEIHPKIEYAETLPAFFYRNESYFKLTKQQIFARSWHFINDETTAFEKGNLYPFTLTVIYDVFQMYARTEAIF